MRIILCVECHKKIGEINEKGTITYISDDYCCCDICGAELCGDCWEDDWSDKGCSQCVFK